MDPTEPPASAPYPYPPVSHEPRIQQLFDDLKAAGFHPFPAPCGIMLNEQDMANSTCIRCQTCDGFPCLVHAKSDAEVLGVRPALQYPNVTLLRNSRVLKLNTSCRREIREGSGRGTRRGNGDFQRGYRRRLLWRRQFREAVVDAPLTISTPMVSPTARTRSGETTCTTTVMAVLAISKEPNPTFFQKTIAINDFYFGMDGFDFPMGNIQMVGKSVGEMYKGEKPLETALAPLGLLNDIARHAVDFWLCTEDLPDPNNRVSLDRAGNITLSYTPNNQVPKQKLYDKLKSMLKHLGMHPDHLIPRNAYLKTEIPIAGVAHQAGTCRFGKDPKSSVLDINCKAHELDNLYVVDTSFFVSIGAVNPALTAMANALRVGAHLQERLK